MNSEVWDALVIYGQPRFANSRLGLRRTVRLIKSRELVKVGFFWEPDSRQRPVISEWTSLKSNPYRRVNLLKLQKKLGFTPLISPAEKLTDEVNFIIREATKRQQKSMQTVRNATALASQMYAIDKAASLLQKEIQIRGCLPRYIVTTRSDYFLRKKINLEKLTGGPFVTQNPYYYSVFDDNFVIYPGDTYKGLFVHSNRKEIIRNIEIIGAEQVREYSLFSNNPETILREFNIPYSLLRGYPVVVEIFLGLYRDTRRIAPKLKSAVLRALRSGRTPR